jgi:HEAT repeat protein
MHERLGGALLVCVGLATCADMHVETTPQSDPPTEPLAHVVDVAPNVAELAPHVAELDPRIADLIRRARDSAVRVRRAALSAIRRDGESNDALRTVLVEAAADEDEQVRLYAICGLCELFPNDSETGATLRAALRGESAGDRHTAISKIGKMGASGVSYLPDLERAAVETGTDWVRLYTFTAIRQIGRATPTLKRVVWSSLSDEDIVVRSEATRTAGVFCEDEPGLRAHLRRLSTDDVPLVREAAEQALSSLDARRSAE